MVDDRADETWSRRMGLHRYADVSRIVPSRGRMHAPPVYALGNSSLA